MKNLTLVLMSLIGLFCNAQDIQIESFATGFNMPVSIKNAGDSRLFVVEKQGLIKILNDDGSVEATPFLNIDNLVVDITDPNDERGLLGLTFHPNYVTNGHFYVNYINNSGNTIISRFTRNTVNEADVNSELILMTINQPFANHNGGDLAFDSNGYLFIATGDGGSAEDPGDRSQNITLLLGKMLRIDVDNTSTGKNYAIPNDNPYATSADGANDPRPEIWAYGLRNPWKFSFDTQTNELWIADVGQYSIEEINMVSESTPNINYGWRCYEGNSIFNSTDCPASSTLTFPVAQYNHSGNGPFKCSISGGFRYRGTMYPNLQGLYFFADYCSNEIGTLESSGSNWNMSFTQQFSGNGWVAFGEDANKELYIAGINSGSIFKIVDANLSVDENQLNKIKMHPNPANEFLTIDFSNLSNQLQTINIYDIQGKLIKSVTNFNEQIIKLPMNTISNGLYLVEIIDNNGLKNIRKLIIE
ncbi:PQQ-dependent sugar dehydrogenase [Ichthyenterobacterium magnum]|uniref:Putative secreted protein (Por secretion system target) n=1 Tax=Ichthyenterobacterium magnum TaxID=1230530 RepID=A0A420DLH9_9FLAO|nr:PQQ-dependent sugar dehydrogenase [Ichthyenterobacterium magnum]RKE95058.1 putative secreted protein (Por secretion system target) [Ichthyenterobacterium magnum]